MRFQLYKNKLLFIFILLLNFNLYGNTVNSVPHVGLVLSGGVAKGFAHIGVLKVIDSLGIKVDYVGGTSMGAIIGGLYAMGYSGKDIETAVRQIDWSTLFIDSPERNFIPVYEKHTLERYLITFQTKGINIQLPKGIISGHNIINILSEITSPVHEINDFRQLTIPYFCIAADIETGEEIILENGILPFAMRASMAMPTIFSPFTINERLLVDGGIINNFPINRMKERFPGVVIGVDVQTGLLPKEELNSFTSILDQLTSLLDYKKYIENKALCDIYIKPDLEGYSATSFTKIAVDSLIKRGEKAALLIVDELKKYSQNFEDKTTNSGNNLFLPDTAKFDFASLEVTGLTRNNTNHIKSLLGFKPNEKISANQIKLGIRKLFATNEYEYITFIAAPKEKSLHIYCKENIINTINIGINYQQGTSAAVLFNVTRKNNLFNNDILIGDIILSEHPGFKLFYGLDKGKIPAPDFDLKWSNFSIGFYDKGKKRGQASTNLSIIQAGIHSTFINQVTAGFAVNTEMFDYYKIIYSADYTPEIPEPVFKTFYNYKFYLMFDSRNSAVIPSKGENALMVLKIHTDNFTGYNSNPPFISYLLKYQRITGSDKKCLLSTINMRLLSENAEIPLFYKSLITGYEIPSFNEFYICFPGLRFIEKTSHDALVLNFEYRYQIINNHYISGLANIGILNNRFVDLSTYSAIASIGTKYMYKTIAGPIQISLNFLMPENVFTTYLRLGFLF